MKNIQEASTDTLSAGTARTLRTAMLSMPVKQRRAVTGGVMAAMFLAALDATVVSTAMPTVIAQLGGVEIYSWVFSGFMLASTVSGPIWGRLSDLYGRKGFYLAGIGIFVLGSVLAGMSNSMEMLVATRALQGLGAGSLFPIGMTIIGEIYSTEQRAKMQGYFSAIWGFASIIGPLTGGFITENFSWPWVFYINLPVGFIAAWVVTWAMKNSTQTKDVKVDYLGAMALTGSMSLLLFGLLQGSQWGWLTFEFMGLMALSAALITFFVIWEQRVSEPIFPFTLFKNRMFTAVIISGTFVGMAMFSTMTFLPLFMQGVLGTSPTEAGAVMMPLSLAWVLSSVIGGRLLLRIGYRKTVFIGMAFLLISFIGFATLSIETTKWLVYTWASLAGIGMGLIIISLILAVQSSASQKQLGIATSASLFSRSMGGVIGVAILGTVMTIGLQQAIDIIPTDNLTPAQLEELQLLTENVNEIVAPSSDQSSFSAEVIHLFRGSLASALHNVFLFSLGFALIAFLVSFVIPKGKIEEHYENTSS